MSDDTMDEIKYIYRIVDGYFDYQNSDKNKNLNKLQNVYLELLSKNFLKTNSKNIPYSFFDFILLLEIPIKNWLNSDSKILNRLTNEYKILKDEPILYNGEINEIFEDFFYEYETFGDLLVSPMKKALDYCHEQESPLQEEYTLIRNTIITKPFMTETEKLNVTNQLFEHPKLQDFFNAQYQEFRPKENKVILCGYCGMPKEKKNGKYTCIRPKICEFYEHKEFDYQSQNLEMDLFDFEDSKQSNSEQIIYLKNNEKYFILNFGSHRFVNLPGQEEIRTFTAIKKLIKERKTKAEIKLYPSLEVEGDIKIIDINNKDILVDAKDIKEFSHFKATLEKDDEKLNEMDYILIPEHRKDYLKKAESFVKKHNKNYQIMTRKKLINDLIKQRRI